MSEILFGDAPQLGAYVDFSRLNQSRSFQTMFETLPPCKSGATKSEKTNKATTTGMGVKHNEKKSFSLGSPSGQTTATLSEDAYIVSNFLRTPPDLLANLLSYDYESMYEQLDRTVYNEYIADDLNGMALNLIAAYDICKNKKMLDVAAEVLNKLSVTFPDVVIYPISLCQIEVRRDGYLSEESLKKLKELNTVAALIPAPDNDEQTNVRRVFYYCAAVVKGDIEEADLLYSQLSDAEKKELMTGQFIRFIYS